MENLVACLGSGDHSAHDLRLGNTDSIQDCGEIGMVGKVAGLVTRTHVRLLFEASAH